MNVWRDGNWIVIHRSQQLPDRCLLTNAYSTHHINQRVAYSVLPKSAQHILVGLGSIPVVGVIFHLVYWVLQQRLTLSIPLCQTEYARYQQRRWTIFNGALISEMVGWIFVQLGDWIVTIGVLGLGMMFAAPLLAGWLWYDRSQLIAVVKMRNDYLWLFVRGNHTAFVNSLPRWQDRLSDRGPTLSAEQHQQPSIGDQFRAIPVRWQGAIMSGLGGYVSFGSSSLLLENARKGLPSGALVEHWIIIGMLSLQVGLLLLIGGPAVRQLLFKSPHQLTGLGGFVAFTMVCLSFLTVICLQIAIHH
jgi:hypothetical protein